MKTKIITLLALTLAKFSLAVTTPCVPHAGEPLPWEGSGACTGNNQIEIALSPSDLKLVYNSIGGAKNYDFGDSAWRLSVDHRLIDETASNPARVIVNSADGSQIVADLQNAGTWYPNPIISKIKLIYSAGLWIEKRLDHSEIHYNRYSDGTWRAVRIVDSKNRITRIFRGTNGQLIRLLRPLGMNARFGYTNGRVTSILLEKGATSFATIGFNYETHQVANLGAQNYLAEVSLPNLTGWSISNFKVGVPVSSNVLSVMNPGKEVQEFSYYPDIEYVEDTDPETSEPIVTILYNAHGLVQQKRYPRENYSEYYQYLQASLYKLAQVIISSSDGRRIESFTNGLLSSELENNITTEYVRGNDGLATTITDSIGQATVLNYDVQKNLIYKSDASGVETIISYNLTNPLLKHKPQGIQIKRNGIGIMSTAYGYDDGTGRIQYSARSNGDGANYDTLGNVEKVFRNGAGVVSYQYNGLSLPILETDELTGLSRQYSYNANNELAAITDSLGMQTLMAYGNLEAPISIAYADGLTQSYVYDEIGQVIVSRIDGFDGKFEETRTTRSFLVAFSPTDLRVQKKKVIEASFNFVPFISKLLPWNDARASQDASVVQASSTRTDTTTPNGTAGSSTTTRRPDGSTNVTGTSGGPAAGDGSSANRTCSTKPSCQVVCHYTKIVDPEFESSTPCTSTRHTVGNVKEGDDYSCPLKDGCNTENKDNECTDVVDE